MIIIVEDYPSAMSGEIYDDGELSDGTLRNLGDFRRAEQDDGRAWCECYYDTHRFTADSLRELKHWLSSHGYGESVAMTRESFVEQYGAMACVLQEAEDLGWSISFYDGDVTFAKHSPLGEDFSFTEDYPCTGNDFEDARELVSSVNDFARDFDAEEHAVMWIANRVSMKVPGTLRDIIKDAEDIDTDINCLAMSMRDALARWNRLYGTSSTLEDAKAARKPALRESRNDSAIKR